MCVTEWFNIYITRVSILLTVNNNKKPLSCIYGVVWLVPFLHDFFGSLIWVFFFLVSLSLLACLKVCGSH